MQLWNTMSSWVESTWYAASFPIGSLCELSSGRSAFSCSSLTWSAAMAGLSTRACVNKIWLESRDLLEFKMNIAVTLIQAEMRRCKQSRENEQKVRQNRRKKVDHRGAGSFLCPRMALDMTWLGNFRSTKSWVRTTGAEIPAAVGNQE